MNTLPNLFQIRKKCIISYTDYSSIEKKYNSTPIIRTGSYTLSAKKRFSKILELWNYSISNENIKMSFVTLTLSSKMNIKTNYTLLLKWLLEKLIYRYGVFNYCWKIEFQKNGNLHFHLIIDTCIDWKIVRKQWNKLQKLHVDEYQIKQKMLYKKGYFYNDKIIDSKGNVVEEKTQQKRYYNGVKANWRNPNSTDVKIVECINGIEGYIAKYVSKEDTEENYNTHEHSISNFWGCSDSLRLLKYCVIQEYEIPNQLIKELQNNNIREILDSNSRYICTIIEKVSNELLISKEKDQLEANKTILGIGAKRTVNKLVQKEINFYDKLYG